MKDDLVLTIPAEVLEAVQLPPDEIRVELLRELAIALYQRRVLSLGKARELAQMTRWEFEDLLGRRKVTRHYTEADLKQDIDYARHDQ